MKLLSKSGVSALPKSQIREICANAPTDHHNSHQDVNSFIVDYLSALQECAGITAESPGTAETLESAIGSLSNVIQNWSEKEFPEEALSAAGMEWLSMDDLLRSQRNRMELLLGKVQMAAFKRMKASLQLFKKFF